MREGGAAEQNEAAYSCAALEPPREGEACDDAVRQMGLEPVACMYIVIQYALHRIEIVRQIVAFGVSDADIFLAIVTRYTLR